jgi:hypothetical protein
LTELAPLSPRGRNRASEICIGIVCADIVLAGTDFGGARFRFARDSPLERTGFELAVPLRWTALRSEVVEEAFGSARYNEWAARNGLRFRSTP